MAKRFPDLKEKRTTASAFTKKLRQKRIEKRDEYRFEVLVDEPIPSSNYQLENHVVRCAVPYTKLKQNIPLVSCYLHLPISWDLLRIYRECQVGKLVPALEHAISKSWGKPGAATTFNQKTVIPYFLNCNPSQGLQRHALDVSQCNF
jgi:hypothetical protein